MALKPCRECKRKVSSEAPVCPQCGATNPTAKPAKEAKFKLSRRGWLLAAGAILLISGLGRCVDKNQTGQAAERARTRRGPPDGNGSKAAVPVTGQNDDWSFEEPGPYSIVDREISDSPTKTSIDLRIEVGPSITRNGLDTLMRHLYTKAMAEEGFVHHKNPTSVYAYFYLTKSTYKYTPLNWIGMVAKAHVDEAPAYLNVLTNGDLLQQVNAAIGQKTNDNSDPFSPIVAVGENDDSLTTLFHNSDRSSKVRAYPVVIDPEHVSDTAFFWLEMLFLRVPALTSIRIQIQHKSKVVFDVSISRTVWNALNYPKRVSDLGKIEDDISERNFDGRLSNQAAERARFAATLKFYREALAQIPKANKRIAPEARP